MRTYMFHYVKPFSNYHYFDLNEFEKIIKELKKKYKIISLKEFDSMNKNGVKISDDYIMFTFDDGTIDHFNYVYPILKKYECSGLFFITSCIFGNKILDIHIIHKLLEYESIDNLFEDLKSKLDENNININNFTIEKNFDSKKEALFKQLLQYKLPKNIRDNLLQYLCKKYNIPMDSSKYYFGINEIMKMKSDNMYFGIHTCSHPRLSLLSKDEQKKEIKKNMDDLIDNKIIDKKLLSIAFPYGSYNKDTIEIMNELNINYGFKVDNVQNSKEKKLINRVDCKVLKGK